MPTYKCFKCNELVPCVLRAEGMFPIPEHCPWGLESEWKEVDE